MPYPLSVVVVVASGAIRLARPPSHCHTLKPGCKGLVGEKPDKELPGIAGARGGVISCMMCVVNFAFALS